MRSVLTTLFVGSLIVPFVSAAAFAAPMQTDDADHGVAKSQLKLHPYRSLAQPEVMTIDVAQPARKVNSKVISQLDQAKAHVRGTFAVHYVVPGHAK